MGKTKIVLVVALALFLGFMESSCSKKEEKGKASPTAIGGPLSNEAFMAAITSEGVPSTLKTKYSGHVKVSVKNISRTVWPAKGQPDGKFQIFLSYHWLDRNGKVIIRDGVRTPLPRDLKPDEEVVIDADIVAPAVAGDYILEMDMVQEIVTWFKEKGSKTFQVPVKIE